MADPQTVRAVVARAGFIVDDFVELPHLPEPTAAFKKFIRIDVVPVVRIPDDDTDADGRVDREWLRLSRENGTIAADGTVLLCIEGAGRMPWLRVRVGDKPPRASKVGLPGQVTGFVALSPEGRAATCVSAEEWDTWILTADLP